MTKAQITGIVTPIATALVSFGVFSNQTAAVLVTGATAVGSLALFVSDAVIRAHRSKMHGQQLLLYAVGKIEQLTAQGLSPHAINAAAAAVAVGHEDVAAPPVAEHQPEPGDVDYIPPGAMGGGAGASPRTEAPPPPPATPGDQPSA